MLLHSMAYTHKLQDNLSIIFITSIITAIVHDGISSFLTSAFALPTGLVTVRYTSFLILSYDC